MKLEYKLGKYYADGVEISADLYNNYSQSLTGKDININVIKNEPSTNTDIQRLEEKIDALELLVNQLLKEKDNN